MAPSKAELSSPSFPWERLKGDLPRFKRLTTGHAILMGRKTYESFARPGQEPKPLPERANIVLTTDRNYPREGIHVYHTFREVLAGLMGGEILLEGEEVNKLYFIGGESIYKRGISLADRLELTEVHRKVEGDAFFPESSVEGRVRTFTIEGVKYSFEEIDRKQLENIDTHSYVTLVRR